MATIAELQAHLAAIDAHEARVAAGEAKDPHQAHKSARAGARRMLNESIAALKSGLPDPHRDARTAGEAGMARGPNRPPPHK